MLMAGIPGKGKGGSQRVGLWARLALTGRRKMTAGKLEGFFRGVMIWKLSVRDRKPCPSNPHVKTLTPMVAAFRYREFKEVIRVK